MASKGQRRRNKRNARQAAMITLPGADPVRARPVGRDRRHTNQLDDPARETLGTRCRHAGLPLTDEGRREAAAPWYGCSAGAAMAAALSGSEEVPALWDAICHMRATEAAYHAACGAPSRHGKYLSLLTPVDSLSANADSPPMDMRTEEERSRDAVNAWMRMQGWLGHVEAAAMSECKRVVLDGGRCRYPDGLIRGLRCVSDGVAGRVVVSRSAALTTSLPRGTGE